MQHEISSFHKRLWSITCYVFEHWKECRDSLLKVIPHWKFSVTGPALNYTLLQEKYKSIMNKNVLWVSKVKVFIMQDELLSAQVNKSQKVCETS